MPKEIQTKTVNAPSIMQMYRKANDIASSSTDLDAIIEAYNKVIKFCNDNESCRIDRSVKRNTLLYWAYNNVGDAYLEAKQFVKAVEYYQSAFLFAVDGVERISSLNNLAECYWFLNDKSHWLEVKEKVIEDLPFSERRAAYLQLIEKIGDNRIIAEILERALQMVTKEEIPISLKCEHVLRICNRLQKIYSQEKDVEALQRIDELYKKTTALATKAVDKKH